MTETYTYLLPNNLDISNVNIVYKEIFEAIQNHKSLLIDASKVSSITTPSVQLIVYMLQNIDKVKIINCSENFNKIFIELGFSKLVDAWSK